MASYKRVILKSDNISELTNDAGYITSSSGLANGTLISGATYKQGTSSANDAQLWTNNQLRLNINGSGTTYLYGSLILSGNRTIGTQSGSHSLSINPHANLMLGSDSTDHIYIGNPGRNITMRGETTFSASTSGISWNDLSNKPSIFMHDYATVTGNPTFAGTTTFTGTLQINSSATIRSQNNLFTVFGTGNYSGTWATVQSRGINLGDWYRQPSYGEINVGEYNFIVRKGNNSSFSTILSVNQSGVLGTGDVVLLLIGILLIVGAITLMLVI